ncbi:hypothetical protein HYALB_00005956 [Hymenoscyphus albidus]|uniref:Uncharacterized protein n=1 Tax=Hymenoscyphus albidus TaxID=595503 RepID=A0A9N9PQH7_9HELO|nr:hypothetical protein HYALB_00005956 [Hymenoscyphus albidus]
MTTAMVQSMTTRYTLRACSSNWTRDTLTRGHRLCLFKEDAAWFSTSPAKTAHVQNSCHYARTSRSTDFGSSNLGLTILKDPIRRWGAGRAVSFSTFRRLEKENGHSPEPSPPKKKKPLLKALKALTPHENIYTVPNILTATRLIAAPVVGYLVLHDQHAWAVGLFAYAGITDLVDGWIARKCNLQTVVGTVIDPMADKTLMTILTVCLAIKGALPVWLAAIILGRDVALAISAIYFRWISLPPPKTFTRYWDFSLPSAEVHPTTISKYNTALQLGLIGATTAMPLVGATMWGVEVAPIMTGMQYLVATTTIWSGLSYIYTKDAVKILSQDNASPSSSPEGSKGKKEDSEI